MKPPTRTREFLARLDLLTLRSPERRYALLTRFESLRRHLRQMGMHPHDLDGLQVKGQTLNTLEKTLAMAVVYCGFDYERAFEVLAEPCSLDASAVKLRASLLRKQLNSPDDPIGRAAAVLMASSQDTVDLTPERTLAELYQLAMMDLGDVVAWDERGQVTFTPSDQLTRGQRLGVAEMTVTTGRGGEVTTRIRMHDKMKALELLAKHQGLTTERVDVKVDISIADRLERARTRVLDGQTLPPALPAPREIDHAPLPDSSVSALDRARRRLQCPDRLPEGPDPVTGSLERPAAGGDGGDLRDV